MRCPKCHYIGFEPEPRCKNCGYDLAFGSEESDVTPANSEEERLTDLDDQIRHASQPSPSVPPPPVPVAVVEAASPTPTPTPTATLELPLFVKTMSDAGSAPAADLTLHGDDDPVEDEPLVRLPPAPRPPLSVRRPTPAPGRVREKYYRDLLDPEPEPPAGGMWVGAPPLEPASEETPVVLESAEVVESVGAFRRVEAALVDLMFLGAISIGVIWLTLQRLDLTFGEIGLLPVWPLAAFLFVVNAGYLLMFTAIHGQTIGKMAAGIRVVGGSSEDDRVTLKQAALRALLTFPSVLVLGAGFFPALLGSHLALHDRFTHTRVVRA